MKTLGSANTIDNLEQQIAQNQTQFSECLAGTNDFKTLIPENSYRSQICQHAAALGLDYVLMVYSAPGAFPKNGVSMCWR